MARVSGAPRRAPTARFTAELAARVTDLGERLDTAERVPARRAHEAALGGDPPGSRRS